MSGDYSSTTAIGKKLFPFCEAIYYYFSSAGCNFAVTQLSNLIVIESLVWKTV